MKVLFLGYGFVFLCLLPFFAVSSLFNIHLPHKDSQFLGYFQASSLTVTHNISSNLTLREALEECADQEQPFLFKTNTSLFKCGIIHDNEVPTNLTMVNCSGEQCRWNLTTVEVYNTSLYETITIPLFTRVRVSINTDKSLENCSYEPGDVIVTQNIASKLLSFFDHMYLSLGVFRTRIICSQSNTSEMIRSSRRISITVTSVLRNLNCPGKQYLSTKGFQCDLQVLQASGVNVHVEIGEKMTSTYELPETSVKIYDAKNDSLVEVNCGSNRSIVHVIKSIVFRERFYLKALELFSFKKTTLKLQILRVENQNAETYSINNGESCPPLQNRTDNSTVCFMTSSRWDATSYYINSSTVATTVHNIAVNVHAGYNHVMLNDVDSFMVERGDVIGVVVDPSENYVSETQDTNPSTVTIEMTTTVSTTKWNTRRSSQNSNRLKTKTDDVTTKPFSTLGTKTTEKEDIPMTTKITPEVTPSPPQPKVCLGDDVSGIFERLTLYGLKPYTFSMDIEVNTTGPSSLVLAFKNNEKCILNLTQSYIFMQPVESVCYMFRHAIPINVTQAIGFILDYGTNASCAWRFERQHHNYTEFITNGDVIYDDKSRDGGLYHRHNYTFTEHASYRYQVTCSNRISDLSDLATISVRRNISGFNASLCWGTFVYQYTSGCLTAQGFGDYVQYKWYIDGILRHRPMISHWFSKATPPGSYQVTKVTAFNYVSNETLLMSFKVLSNPLTIIRPSIAPSLTPIPLIIRFDWKGYPNAMSFYESYNVSLSKNLTTFLNAPSFLLKDVARVVSRNLSEGISINHTFNRVGFTNMRRNLYAQAIDYNILSKYAYITILDKVHGLNIITACQSEVTVGSLCTFIANYTYGSDVTLSWFIASRYISNESSIVQKFNVTGNTSVGLNASNSVSKAHCSFHIRVNATLTPEIQGPTILKVFEEGKFTAVGFSLMNIEYLWSTNNHALNYTTSSVSLSFHEPGVFMLSLNASNGTFEQYFNHEILVQYPITGFQASVNTSTEHAYITVAIETGTDVNLLVDFGDRTPQHSAVFSPRNITLIHTYNDTRQLYNITMSVSNKVGPNLTKVFTVFGKQDICSVKSLKILGASDDINCSNNYTDEAMVYFSVEVVANCSTITNFQYLWNVERMYGNDKKVDLNITKIIPDSSAVKFHARNLEIGNYKVVVTMAPPYGDIVSTGYFARVLRSLLVMTYCGLEQTVPVSSEVILNATVVGQNSENYSFEWFCDEHRDISCFPEFIARNSAVVTLPVNVLTAGKVYNFLVEVLDGEIKGTSVHRVHVGFENTALLICIRSPQKRLQRTDHLSTTEFEAICSNCDKSKDKYSWQWSIVPQPAHPDINHVIVDKARLIIPPEVLLSNTQYKITVTVMNSNHKQGHAVYMLQTAHAPSGGYCDVTPTQALVLKVPIIVTCHAWHDVHQPLVYEMLYSCDGETYTSFYRGNDRKTPLSYLESGDVSLNHTVRIKIIVKDHVGSRSIYHVKFQNLPLSKDEFNEMFDFSRDVAQQVDNLINGSEGQAAMQLIKTVSGVLNGFHGDTNTSTLIREALLTNVQKSCCSDAYSTKQTLNTMLTLTKTPRELSAKAQLDASGLFLKIAKQLDGEDLKDGADQLFEGISSIMSASSLSTLNYNLSHIREINRVSLATIDFISDSLLATMEVGEPALMLGSPLVQIALQKHTTDELAWQHLTVNGHSTEFVVPECSEKISNDSIGTKFVSITNNPYMWTPPWSLSPTTSVASLVVQDDHGTEILMKNLTEPVTMFLYTPDPPQMFLNFTDTIEAYAEPIYYDVTISEDHCSFLVTLHEVKATAKGRLRLRVQDINRTRVVRSDVIVSTESTFPLSVTLHELEKDEKYSISVEYESLVIGIPEVPHRLDYLIAFRQIGCYFWNDVTELWDTYGCQVGDLSTHLRTHCICDHLTWFGGRLIVPPNTISLSLVSQRITNPENYKTILIVLSVIFVLYFLAVVWAIRKDKVDNNKDCVVWCATNQSTDSYKYEILVYTGLSRNAGTSASVGIMLLGDKDRSCKCLLKDSSQILLKRGSVQPFIITTNQRLGNIDYVHIWHDNTGNAPAWFLNQVVVTDTQTEETWCFLCYRWLAVDESDGQIQRVLPVAEPEELKQFRHLFVSRATTELTDAHLWFSVVFRPSFSSFTRVQRVSCCLSVLLTSMMANAMWYNVEETGHDQIDLGIISFSWREVFIGICSSLIIFPVNLTIVQLFRNYRTKKHSSGKKQRESNATLTSLVMASLASLRSLAVTSVKKSPTENASYILKEKTQNFTVLSEVMSTKQDSENMTSHKLSSDKVVTSLTEVEEPSFDAKINESDSVMTQSSMTQSFHLTSSLRSRKNNFSVELEAPLLISGNLPYNPTAERSLPHFVVYVAWLLVIMTCLVSVGVTFIYCVQFGEKKTRHWFISLGVSLINDIFVAQPLKVFAMAIIFAYVFKKPVKTRHYTSQEAIPSQTMETSDFGKLQVPDPEIYTAKKFLKTAREKQEKTKFMFNILKTLCSYLIFTVLVLIIAYGQRDLDAYHLTQVQENTFTKNAFEDNIGQMRTFYEATNIRHFWLWSQNVFIPGLTNIDWYNYTGQWSPYSANFAGYVFGAARWRQKRLKQSICDVVSVMRKTVPECTGNYDWENEDTSRYLAKWRPLLLTNTSCNPPDDWCFTSSSALKSFPYVGDLETYSGGGYIIDVPPYYQKALNTTEELKVQRWINENTRAVFVELTLYNPDVNLFSIITLIFEVSSSGFFNPRAEFLSIRLFNYVGNLQIFILLCHTAFLAFLLYFTYHSCKLLFRERCLFFKRVWNIYELGIVFISWTAVALYFVSRKVREDTLLEFRENPGESVSFWYSSAWQMTLEYTLACLVFLVSLKFLRLFQFNRRLFLLPLTLSNTVWDLANYSLVFAIVLLAFAFLYYLLLHTINPNFYTVIVSMETLMRVFLGKSNELVQRHQYPVLERIILFCYICTMKFLLLNVFIIILNDGFNRAREQINMKRNQFEFVDYLKDGIYEVLGVRKLYGGKNNTKSRHVHFAKDTNEMFNVEKKLVEMEEKIERMYKLTDFVSSEEDFLDYYLSL